MSQVLSKVLGRELDTKMNKNLVACVNILPRMQSVYRWEGELQLGSEHQMLLKTSSS